jgi:hypothetical protein
MAHSRMEAVVFARSASSTACSTAPRIRQRRVGWVDGSVNRTLIEWTIQRRGGRSVPPLIAFVRGYRTLVRVDRSNAAPCLECAAARRRRLARGRHTVSAASRYPTCERRSRGPQAGWRIVAATGWRRDATDEAYSRVHDAIRATFRQATSGIPGRYSRPISALSNEVPKMRSQDLLREFIDREIARCGRELARLITFFDVCSLEHFSVIRIREFFRKWRARQDSNL